MTQGNSEGVNPFENTDEMIARMKLEVMHGQNVAARLKVEVRQSVTSGMMSGVHFGNIAEAARLQMESE